MTMTLYVFPCDLDPGRLTTAEAHRVMQIHLECSSSYCVARRRGRQTLVDTKRMVLDERAEP